MSQQVKANLTVTAPIWHRRWGLWVSDTLPDRAGWSCEEETDFSPSHWGNGEEAGGKGDLSWKLLCQACQQLLLPCKAQGPRPEQDKRNELRL